MGLDLHLVRFRVELYRIQVRISEQCRFVFGQDHPDVIGSWRRVCWPSR